MKHLSYIAIPAALILLLACSDKTTEPNSSGNYPVVTDKTVYTLVKSETEYRAFATASYTNTTAGNIYFPRCKAAQTTPMFSLARTGADVNKPLVHDITFPCDPNVPDGVIPAGNVVTVQVPLGSVERDPPINTAHITGMMQIVFSLCGTPGGGTGKCSSLPLSQRTSNPFEVRYP